jgi:pumilio homology domain family member 6
MLAKSLLAPIAALAPKLYQSAPGRRTLMYPLVPRTLRHYTPALVASLAETDTVRTRTSKKDPVVRAAEVCAAASPDLLRWVENHGADVSRETGGSLIITEVMLEADGGAWRSCVLDLSLL